MKINKILITLLKINLCESNMILLLKVIVIKIYKYIFFFFCYSYIYKNYKFI